MANKSDRRRQKRLQKQKSKGKVRAHRSSRPGIATPGRGVSIDKARSWPAAEGWLSSNWYEQGPTVHAAFVRQNDEDDRVAVSLFHLDLATGAVLEVRTVSGAEGHLHQALSRVSTEDQPMVEVPATTVVRVVTLCAEYGGEQGLEVSRDYREAIRLFGELTAEDSNAEVLFGEEEAVPVKKKKGLLSRIFS